MEVGDEYGKQSVCLSVAWSILLSKYADNDMCQRLTIKTSDHEATFDVSLGELESLRGMLDAAIRCYKQEEIAAGTVSTEELHRRFTAPIVTEKIKRD